MYVVTFLCNPLVPKLTDALISKYLISLGGDNVTWLKEGVAVEFSIPEIPKNYKKYWSLTWTVLLLITNVRTN